MERRLPAQWLAVVENPTAQKTMSSHHLLAHCAMLSSLHYLNLRVIIRELRNKS